MPHNRGLFRSESDESRKSRAFGKVNRVSGAWQGLIRTRKAAQPVSYQRLI